MVADEPLRQHIVRLLQWEDAHVGFDAAVADLAPALRGVRPADLPWSAWELVEHLRLTQRDILDFCLQPDYQERQWPEEYWPQMPAPPAARAWQGSTEAFRKDREKLCALARNSQIELSAKIPHGSGQTYLREFLLAADHAAYHVGQLIVVRRLLHAWRDR